MKNWLKKEEIISWALLGISFFLIFYVYLKSNPDFPVILKKNELGFNFLTQRTKVFNFYILGVLFLFINKFLEKKIEIKEINLRKAVKYANIVITLIVFLISLQIYLLNL